jgi:hypothetical protein
MLKAGKATSVKLRTMRVCSALPIVGIFALNPFFFGFWFLVVQSHHFFFFRYYIGRE